MSTKHETGQGGLAPSWPQSLDDFSRETKQMGDADLAVKIAEYRKATATGAYGRERLEILETERQHRTKHRRGEGRLA